VSILRLGLVLGVLFVACDGSRTQAPPPLDPPLVESSQSGGVCSRTEVDGATVSRFESDGSCLPGDVMVLYRCSPTAVPVLRISSVAGPALLLGGPFAVPVNTLPANVRVAGESDGTEVLIADPLPRRSSPSVSLTEEDSVEPLPQTEPLVYVRNAGVTERWLRLDGRRALHEPPIVWLIGDSILDGGRDAVEAGLSDWSVALDAEVGRSSSSGVMLATEAAELDADVVVMELGTNDSSAEAFRGHVVETLDILASIPLVIWQTAKGPEDGRTIPAVNEAIRQVAPAYPNVAIADWETFAPEEALQIDGIHPDEGFEHLESELLLPLLSEWRAATSTDGATSCGRKVVRGSS
jgi:hypothetical protein